MIRRALKTIPGAVWLKRHLFGPSSSVELALQRASDRGPHPPRKTIPTPPDFPAHPRFVLYRIIGNDLEPRHRKGQARANLPFILRHEPELADCEKRFVVNRIVDPGEEAAIIDILEKAGYRYLHIPFRLAEYAQQPWDIQAIPAEYAPSTPGFARLRPDQQARIIARVNRHKNNYVIHNNGARNLALAEGRQQADWVLPWDGNCFLTQSAWNDIRADLQSRPDVPYWLVPMARTRNNDELHALQQRPPAPEEPQVIFRRDAAASFDPAFFYGRRPKVELFWRLGVPGKWDDWGIEPWDLPVPDFSDEAGAWEVTGWVARLSSGRSELEVKRQPTRAERARAQARAEATLGLLGKLDRAVIRQNLPLKVPLLSRRADTGNASREGNETPPLAAAPETAIQARQKRTSLAEHCRQIFLMGVAASHIEAASGDQKKERESLLDQIDSRLQAILNTPPSATLKPRLPGIRTAVRPDAPFVPELFYCIDTIRYLDLSGRLAPERDRELRDWSSRRLGCIDHAFRRYRAVQNEPRCIGSYFLEATTLAAHLEAEHRLAELLRDAQFRLQEKSGAIAPAHHRACLVKLAKRLAGPGMCHHFDSSRLNMHTLGDFSNPGVDPDLSADTPFIDREELRFLLE